MELILVILVPVVPATLAFFVSWAIKPLTWAARDRRAPVQFSLADLLGLFVLVQLTLGGMLWFGRNAINEKLDVSVWTAITIVTGLAALNWWGGVRMLSQAGVGTVWQRFVTLTIVLPVAYVGSIAVMGMSLVTIVAVVSLRPTTVSPWLPLIDVAVIAMLCGCRRFLAAITQSAAVARGQPLSPLNDDVRESWLVVKCVSGVCIGLFAVGLVAAAAWLCWILCP